MISDAIVMTASEDRGYVFYGPFLFRSLEYVFLIMHICLGRVRFLEGCTGPGIFSYENTRKGNTFD